MAIAMQVTLRRLGQYAHLWADGRTDLLWSDGEIAALSWLERRYTLTDLRVILERSESCIRDRQEQRKQQTGSDAITPAEVTLAMSARRSLAAWADRSRTHPA